MVQARLGSVRLDALQCIECGASIPVSKAIEAKVAEQLQSELGAKLREEQEALATAKQALLVQRATLEDEVQCRVERLLESERANAEQKARSASQLELDDLKRQVGEAN